MSSYPVSFDVFYRVHHPWLLKLLQRKIADLAVAEDLTQETFARLCATGRQIGDLLAELDSPKAYLHRLAHGLYVDNVRRAVVEESVLAALSDAHAAESSYDSAEAYCELAESVARVALALDELPERERQAFLLYRFSAFNQLEIAEQLSVPLSTLKKWLARALVACHLALEQAQ